MKKFFLTIGVLIGCIVFSLSYVKAWKILGEPIVSSFVMSGGIFLSYLALTRIGRKIRKFFQTLMSEALRRDREISKKQELFTDFNSGNELRVAFWSVKPDQMVSEEVLTQRLRDAVPEREDVITAYASVCLGFMNSVDDMQVALELLQEAIQDAVKGAGLQGVPGLVRLSYRGTSELQTAVIQLLNSGSPKAIETLQYDFAAGRLVSRGLALSPVSLKLEKV